MLVWYGPIAIPKGKSGACDAVAADGLTSLLMRQFAHGSVRLQPFLSLPRSHPMSDRTGRCLCGAVRYRITADPLFTRICWCSDCQHIAGNGTVNILVPAAALEVSGTTNAYSSAADSGNRISRRFCPSCGCHLFADSSGRPQYTVVRAGTLDDPSSVTPSTNIWTSSAPRWACMDAKLERVERQPAPLQKPSEAVHP